MRQLLIPLFAVGVIGLQMTGCRHSPLPPNATPPRAARLVRGAAVSPAPAVIPGSPRGAETPALRGRRFAQAHCAGCHAIGDIGSSPNPDAKPFRDIVKVYPPENLQEAFAEGIAVGHPKMPPFALRPDDADDIIAYLRTLER